MNQRSTDFGQQRQAEFGLYLRALRKHRHLKQKDVASELGISAGELCSIEKGYRRAGDQLLVELADKYRVPLEELLRKKYWPQLPLLTGIMEPTEHIGDLQEDLHPEDVEELRRYTAFLRLRRARANKS